MKRKISLLSLVLVLVFCFIATSCGKTKTETVTKTETETETATQVAETETETESETKTESESESESETKTETETETETANMPELDKSFGYHEYYYNRSAGGIWQTEPISGKSPWVSYIVKSNGKLVYDRRRTPDKKYKDGPFFRWSKESISKFDIDSLPETPTQIDSVSASIWMVGNIEIWYYDTEHAVIMFFDDDGSMQYDEADFDLLNKQVEHLTGSPYDIHKDIQKYVQE